METINAIGRRKAAVARVYVSNGTGAIKINGREYKEYFPQAHISAHVIAPLLELDLLNTYDVKVNVSGGGFRGQSEAIRLAISRAMTKINADYRAPLKIKKFLTRDARVVERKKFGKPKARKSFQFSKR
ncbi:MAG: 30S ribosomal protein S9 [Bacteroidota bacterium]|nr:30S ribosomal protein S9 [Bacteroidota bacterium]